MDIAEQAAQAQKESDIDINFPFYNGKNLTDLNSLPEVTTTKVKNNNLSAFSLLLTFKH